MNTEEKQKYLDKYQEEKKKGVPFFPDIIFKDAVISLIIFLILAALAYFMGAPLEERANPADTNYTPKPEWYFLFLFQLLKYFPGELEVIGVFVLPTIAILLLFALPMLDKSPRRHPLSRLPVVGITFLLMVGVIYLTFESIMESPPPAEAAGGDQTAVLYLKNCASCHGPSITIATGVDLHAIIAEGKHEGMPAWSADLTADEIDTLAGFILSPAGSNLFTSYCGGCHIASDLVASGPLELKSALQDVQYTKHAGADVPDYSQELTAEQRTALLNFLVAPDGQRLFTTNCSSCHGRSVAFSGGSDELRGIISQGGMHLEMPAWRDQLSDSELDALAEYVTAPAPSPQGIELFARYCAGCHGDRVPTAASEAEAQEIIASGGAHQTMPVWGDILTSDQLDSLVNYTLEAASGTPLELGQELFTKNCAVCHGALGEGGQNPVNPNDIIAPISSAEYLKTRDDFTLRSVISQGQPNFGMSPFGTANGGPLEDQEIDAIVTYMRTWEINPPVEVPPEVAPRALTLSGAEIYFQICAQCHGLTGEGGVGPSFQRAEFQDRFTDQGIFDTIKRGHESTMMIGWGQVLTQDQILDLVKHIRSLKEQPAPASGAALTPIAPAGPITFAKDILPLFNAKCNVCHGSMGGWDGSTYQAVMTTGDNAPVIISGDAEGSLLGQKILGTHTQGTIMPPMGRLPQAEIQLILDWIASGALE